jgi:DNA invertase Pin-like site-specific DNA recombinase
MAKTYPEKLLIGYARVSTYGQTLDSQLEQLRKAGCTSRYIYREKVTRARADRRDAPSSARASANASPVSYLTRLGGGLARF